jgi:hypothetical protein
VTAKVIIFEYFDPIHDYVPVIVPPSRDRADKFIAANPHRTLLIRELTADEARALFDALDLRFCEILAAWLRYLDKESTP